MIYYSDTPQGTPEWLAERCGLLTASNFATAMGKGETRKKLMHKLRAERRTGIVESGYKTPAMQRGNDLEPEARAVAAFELGVDIKEVGLATNGRWAGLGASLDGLIGDSVGWETKCPTQTTHDIYLWENRLPPRYKWQVYGQMMICELQAIWFMSYYPGDDNLLIKVERDEEAIAELQVGLMKFMSELDSMA